MIKFHDFQPSGFVSSQLPDDVFFELKKRCKGLNEPANYRLAGNIEKEYSLNIQNDEIGKKLLNHIFLMSKEYEKRYAYPNIKVLNKDLPMKFGEIWVNYQKKYEFNPIHQHTGVWSFVIWVQIPYDIEDELKNPSGINSNSNLSSIFQFTYRNIYGNATEELYIDKSHEGTIILFPSSLLHCVYPFYTSDDYRISIAGNICFHSD